MKNYCLTYRKEEFVRIVFKCDNTLDPMDNIDDYNFIAGLVSNNDFERYEVWTDGPFVCDRSIGIDYCSESEDAEVLVSRHEVLSYPLYQELHAVQSEDEDTQTSA
jgi:hypothetical protein